MPENLNIPPTYTYTILNLIEQDLKPLRKKIARRKLKLTELMGLDEFEKQSKRNQFNILKLSGQIKYFEQEYEELVNLKEIINRIRQ